MAGRSVDRNAPRIPTLKDLSVFATKADIDYVKSLNKSKKKSSSTPEADYTAPINESDIYESISNLNGVMTINGFQVIFTTTAARNITLPGSGTMMFGTGSVGVIPQFSNAYTLTDSNLSITGSNALELEASAAATLTVPYTGTTQVVKAVDLVSSSAISMDWNAGSLFRLTPAHTATITPSNGYVGQNIQLIITTSGTSSYTLTFGSPFKTSGTLATGTSSGKVFSLNFVFDGTNYVQIYRSAAM